MIRSWLRENDFGSKGYVDMNDFQRIFNQSKGLSQDYPRYRHVDVKPSHSSRPTEFVDSDRIARVKRYIFIKNNINILII